MNQLLLIKTPIIEEIRTNQYRGAKIELFLRLKTPTTGAGTSRLKIWLEAKFSLKAAPLFRKPILGPRLLTQKIAPVLARQQIGT